MELQPLKKWKKYFTNTTSKTSSQHPIRQAGASNGKNSLGARTPHAQIQVIFFAVALTPTY